MSAGPFQPVSCPSVTSGAQSSSEERNKAMLQDCEWHLGLERCLYFQASIKVYSVEEKVFNRRVLQEPGGGWRIETLLGESLSQFNLKEECSASPRHQHWDGLPWAAENSLVVELKAG